ncbi:MAG TPA: hypothetical protein VGI39_15080 [Polyangiaceae bacterium]|jgi:hypothetical protein
MRFTFTRCIHLGKEEIAAAAQSSSDCGALLAHRGGDRQTA